MADNLTLKQRTKNMKRIKSKDTSVEIKLRKVLWNQCHYKNVKSLLETPDIMIT